MMPALSNSVIEIEDERPKTAATLPPSRQGKDRFTIAAAGRKVISTSTAKASRDNKASECTAFESRSYTIVLLTLS